MTTKVFKFGCTEPTNLKQVEEQLYQAHRYKQQLVTNAQDHRAAREARLIAVCPEYARLDAQCNDLDAQLEEVLTQIKRQRASARQRIRLPELERQAKDLKAQKKQCAKERTAAKHLLYCTLSPEYDRLYKLDLDDDDSKAALKEARKQADKDLYAEQNQVFKVANIKARAEAAANGVHWGTYQAVEAAIEQAITSGREPKRKRYDGNGGLYVNLTNGGKPPLTLDELYQGNTFVKLDRPPSDAHNPKVRRLERERLQWVKARIRIQSDPSSNRIPVWAETTVKLHRPLPDDAEVCTVALRRIKVAHIVRWELQLTVKTDDAKPRATTGTVGVDIGFRRVETGLRVAYWAGDDGRQGELVIPLGDDRNPKSNRLGAWKKVADLQSIRADNFNEVKTNLGEWLNGRKVPDWLVEATTTLPQWRSQKRLAELIGHPLDEQARGWRFQRFKGDEPIFTALEAWRKQDKHLYQWQRTQETKIGRWRKDLYRKFASDRRQEYATIKLEKIDLKHLQDLPDPDEQACNGAFREYRPNAALSEFIEAIRQTGDTERVEANNTTRECHLCGHVNNWQDQEPIFLTCESCKERWDQDYNAANVIRNRPPIEYWNGSKWVAMSSERLRVESAG